MRRLPAFFIIWMSTFVIAHRSPAPIVEQPENPTPPPQQETSKPASKPRHKVAESSEENQPAPKSKEPAKPRERFGGTWTGKINQGLMGDVVFTLTFSNGGSEVTEHTSLGTYSHVATVSGQTASWKSGLLSEIVWTFTPNSDGNTARATAKSPFGINGDATFHRGGTPAVVKPAAEFPTARPVPERPGFVYNPFDPSARFIDIRGKPSGTKLVDPKSGKTFIVP